VNRQALIGRKSRAKGAAFERQVAKLIKEDFGVSVARDLRQYQKKGHGDLIGWPGTLIECKARVDARRAAIRDWWAETVAEAALVGCRPVLIYKLDRQPLRVVLSLSDVAPTDAGKDTDCLTMPVEMDWYAFRKVVILYGWHATHGGEGGVEAARRAFR